MKSNGRVLESITPTYVPEWYDMKYEESIIEHKKF